MHDQGIAFNRDFDWQPQPLAAELVRRVVDVVLEHSDYLRDFEDRLGRETGTRLTDFMDHLGVPGGFITDSELESAGFSVTSLDGKLVWSHGGGHFPRICIRDDNRLEFAVKVESVVDFLHASGSSSEVSGGVISPFRTAEVWSSDDAIVSVVERHGYQGFYPEEDCEERAANVLRHLDLFRRRQRHFKDDRDGFDYAATLVRSASEQIGVNWTCDLFFKAEREYWQSRNLAARVQKARQDALGLGWANHDHHTYRSSREYFSSLVAVLEILGFSCRERFYAGREAGWGAQVLEQKGAGITIFADVDLRPEEVTEDFAHEGLEVQSELGTVGLWCKLHGEAFLGAGMHHLEGEFNFDLVREHLAGEGIESMAPFTDFEYLKQAFTVGEVWEIDASRVSAALEGGYITEAQAEQFMEQGAIGSHLEVLQRDDGYKGFNQTGISEIIARTDPRRN